MTTLTLKRRGNSGPYYVHFTGDDGRRMRISTGKTDPKDAQQAAARIIAEARVYDRQGGGVRLLGQMLSQTWDRHWANQKDAPHKKSIVNRIIREVGHLPLEQVTHDRIEAYLNSRTVGDKNPEPMKPATKNRYVSTISKALEFCHRDVHDYRAPKLPHWREDNVRERYVSPDEEQRLVAWFEANTAPANHARVYMYNLFLLLLDSGMRCGEAIGVMTKELLVQDTDGDWLVHLPHGETKTSRARVVPLTRRAAAAAQVMVSLPSHGRWNSQRASRAFANICGKVGIEDVGLHTLRHTAASRLVQAGVDIYLVAAYLGHSSVEVTRRYAHLAPSNLKGAMRALQGHVPPSPPADPVGDAHPTGSGTQKAAKLYAIK